MVCIDTCLQVPSFCCFIHQKKNMIKLYISSIILKIFQGIENIFYHFVSVIISSIHVTQIIMYIWFESKVECLFLIQSIYSKAQIDKTYYLDDLT